MHLPGTRFSCTAYSHSSGISGGSLYLPLFLGSLCILSRSFYSGWVLLLYCSASWTLWDSTFRPTFLSPLTWALCLCWISCTRFLTASASLLATWILCISWSPLSLSLFAARFLGGLLSFSLLLFLFVPFSPAFSFRLLLVFVWSGSCTSAPTLGLWSSLLLDFHWRYTAFWVRARHRRSACTGSDPPAACVSCLHRFCHCSRFCTLGTCSWEVTVLEPHHCVLSFSFSCHFHWSLSFLFGTL